MTKTKKYQITEEDKKSCDAIVMPNGIRYIPSEYQKRIFNEILHTSHNIVIEAAAGSAKTTTLIKCIDLLNNDEKVLFVAFNRDIVNDISKKIKGRDNVEVRTLHSLGSSILYQYLGVQGMKPNEYKYNNLIQDNLYNLSQININILNKSQLILYKNNIKALTNFGRFNLATCIKDMEQICQIHNIECIGDEKEFALAIMDIGKTILDDIDFTDMIWLPNVLNINNIWKKYDYIMLDEAQDSNIAEYELLMKCFKMGTRIICAGDEKQAIYSFAGSSIEAFDKYKALPNTVSLPLSISYRCPKKIVEFARKFSPNIEAKNDAIDGIIEYDKNIKDIKDSDAVLCRNNAPLMKVYIDLLKSNKKAYIMGKDIGSNLIKLIKNTNKQYLHKDLREDGVFLSLYNNLFDDRDRLMKLANIDIETASNSSIIENEFDSIQTLEILSDGISSSEKLIERINEIFSDNKKDGIILSTCHKAKGREFNNVFICCDSLMPNKRAKQEWEKQQEKNLQYVAYTRTKNNLYFLSEKGFEGFLNNALNGISSKLQEKEIIVNKILNRKPYIKTVTPSNYKDIIQTATHVKPVIINKTTLNNKTKKEKNNANIFDSFGVMKNKKRIKI